MSKKEEKDRFLTIREALEKYLDNQKCQVFQMVFDGNQSAATAKRQARLTILVPRTIVDTNLKDMFKFVFMGIAIPKEEF